MREPLAIGSPDHCQLLARCFRESFLDYSPERIDWPPLSGEDRSRLEALPFWRQAVFTEAKTARIVQLAATLESHPELSGAIALQGFEEGRHARLLEAFLEHYQLPKPELPELEDPEDLERAFLGCGYAECFDSFFAFGLFRLARESGFISPAVIDLFEPVMQEEARHILFFVNWVAQRRARLSGWQRARFTWRCVATRVREAAERLTVAREMKAEAASGRHFTMAGHAHLELRISPLEVLQTCLAENERRLSLYDPRLLRPSLVPGLVRGLLKLAPARMLGTEPEPRLRPEVEPSRSE